MEGAGEHAVSAGPEMFGGLEEAIK